MLSAAEEEGDGWGDDADDGWGDDWASNPAGAAGKPAPLAGPEVTSEADDDGGSPTAKPVSSSLSTPSASAADLGGSLPDLGLDVASQSAVQEDGAAPRTKALALLGNYRGLILDVYRQHNPSKIGDVDAMFAKYEDQIDKVQDLDQFIQRTGERLQNLYEALCKKYGLVPGQSSPQQARSPEAAEAESSAGGAADGGMATRLASSDSAATGNPRPVSAYRTAIVAVYEEHNPDKLGSVDGLLDKFKGREEMLYRSVCQKYNVEPAASLLTDDDAEGNSESRSSAASEPVMPSLGGWGGSLWGGGFSALTRLSSAAEGIQRLRQQAERSFEDALRSEEDVSMLQAVKGLASGATEVLASTTNAVGEQTQDADDTSVEEDGKQTQTEFPAEQESGQRAEQEQEEARVQAEEEACLTAEKEQEEARRKAEEEVRLTAEQEQEGAIASAEEEARVRAEQEQEEAKRKAEEEARLRAEKEQDEAIANAEEEARVRAEQEQEESKRKEEEEARLRAEKEQEGAIASAEEEARVRAEQEQEEAKRKAEEEARLRAEKEQDEAIANAEEEARVRAEQEQEEPSVKRQKRRG
ncbi:unnamed protein product [Polarella glacialis]|uniref:Uncharacterized protein n=1 Tax=Polarella glacialis TaxID=89957 RepID=A0A813L613_POLGL|nr:unnamed protein product [Polarella glacialis]